MVINPLDMFSAKPVISENSMNLVENGFAVHYRHDLPGELEAPGGFSHHLLTFFLTTNKRQVTRIEGHGEYDGQMTQGDFYLCSAGIPGRTSWHSVDETFHVILEPGLLRRVALETDCINSANIELLPVLNGRDRKIEHLVQLFMAEIDPHLEAIAHSPQAEAPQASIGGRLYTESLANLFTIHLLRHYCTHPITLQTYDGGLSRHSLRQVLDYIQASLDQDLSLDALANVVNMSKYYFIELFKQSMGMTPHQYVIQQRIKRAQDLLNDRTLAISEISLACGFANQSHFTRLFRTLTGTTPKAYREQ